MSIAFLRKASLMLLAMDPKLQQDPINAAAGLSNQGLDLSDFHFKFNTAQSDVESPNSCSIRVYNLKPETVARIRGEFSWVVVQAGYQNGIFGKVFEGQVRQFRIGKEKSTDTYLDILAGDGDQWYAFGTVSTSLQAAEATPKAQALAALANASAQGVQAGYIKDLSWSNAQGNFSVLSRGKVLFGMARNVIRAASQNYGSTWSINNGIVSITPLTGYLPGTPVKLDAATGLIGRVEQTESGIKMRALMNPLLGPGGLVKIDNRTLNETLLADPNNPVPFDQRVGVLALPSINTDGLYRIYVAEFKGDTRGQDWYVDLVALGVEPTGQTVKAYP